MESVSKLVWQVLACAQLDRALPAWKSLATGSPPPPSPLTQDQEAFTPLPSTCVVART